MIRGGDYKEDLTESEHNSLYFVGDYKNPIDVGIKGEIFANVDGLFYEIYDIFRWVRSGMANLCVEKDPAILTRGVRALMEMK